MNKLSYKLLRPGARAPERATPGSAGYDLYALLDRPVVIMPNKIAMIPTGIAIAIADKNTAAFIYARSGLASKYGITLANSVGVIDSDYRGEIMVPLINHGDTPFTINTGDRFAQMVISKVMLPEFCENQDTFDSTERGTGGFGSTG
ncbi:MAG: dUTP diphosphatase [Oscillospiraceae bacterium]|nr:dUTP diphosphatase [Oscillospiraceae bacterium]